MDISACLPNFSGVYDRRRVYANLYLFVTAQASAGKGRLSLCKNIIMPKFNIEEDAIAQQYIQEAFQDCNIRQIEMAEIAKEGGALHCISWNVYLPKSHVKR